MSASDNPISRVSRQSCPSLRSACAAIRGISASISVVAQLIVRLLILMITDVWVIVRRPCDMELCPRLRRDQETVERRAMEQIRLEQRWWLSPKQNISSAVSCEVATVADVVALTSFADVLPGGIIHSGCL